jgi:IS605 OrfB family transposase
VVGRGVQVPKIGRVRLRLSQPVEGQTKSATFKQDACGHWHVSLVAETQMPAIVLPLPDPACAVGLDLGLKEAVLPSDAPPIPAPRFYRRGARKLRRAQRSHSRRQKGSHNKAKARAKVARIHQRMANQRAHFVHDLTTKVIKNHQAVCIENLNVRGLARTKLAKSFYDAAMGMIRRQLQYKGQWYGVPVVVVDRFYPSTRLCHVCGFKNEALTLSDRTWPCPICGTLLDRDVNAALNIRDEGLRILAVAGPPEGSGEPKRLRRGGKTTDGGAPRRTKNPTALAVRSVNILVPHKRADRNGLDVAEGERDGCVISHCHTFDRNVFQYHVRMEAGHVVDSDLPNPHASVGEFARTRPTVASVPDAG